MAIGVFRLTFKQRKTLSVIFYTLNSLQVLTALIVTGLSMYIYFSVAPIFYSETAEINFVFVVLGMYSTQVAIQYLLGFKITFKCVNQAYKKSTRYLLLLWTLAGLILMINLVILMALSRKVASHLNRSMKHSLKIGMQNYLKNKNWKAVIDKIQYQLGCCGIESYKDWYETSWLSRYHVNENSELAKKFSGSEPSTYTITPWSCCRVDFPLQCLHDPLQQIQSEKVWNDEPNVPVDSINPDGCLNVMQKPIESVLMVFCLTTSFQVIVNAVIFIISRLLYTSCRNALLLRDPVGLSAGWLFGRGDFGYRRGKSLKQIMADFREKDAARRKKSTSKGNAESDTNS